MKALIIPDSFKGSLTASQVANQMAKAVKIVFPNASCTITPFSDGGEGAIEVLKNEAEGKIIDSNLRGAELERKLQEILG